MNKIRVAVNRRECDNQLAVPSGQTEAQRLKQLRPNQILVAPSPNVQPLGLPAPQLCTLQNRVVVQELGIRLEHNVALAAGQNQRSLGKAVLPRVAHILLRPQHLLPHLHRQSIVNRTLLLPYGNIGVLGKAEDC